MNIQRKKFRYSLMKDATTWYYVAAGGAVLTSATTTPLRKDPLEWKDTDLRWMRNSKYHGIFRSFVVPMTFARDGATILRHIYYTQGVEGKCLLRIHRLNHTSNEYELYYEGDIDFSQALDSRLTFQAAILDSGLAALIKAKESTSYAVAIMNSDSIPVYMDGIKLRGNARFVVPSQGGAAAPIGMSNTLIAVSRGAEGINEATVSDTTFQTIPATLDLAHSMLYSAKYNEVITITSKLYLNVFWPSSASVPVKFAVGVKTGVPGGTVTDTVVFKDPNWLNPGQSRTLQINPGNLNFATPINGGDSVGVVFLFLDAGNNILSSINARIEVLGDDGYIDIATEYTRPATNVRWLRQIQVLQKIVALMGSGLYTAASNYLTSTVLRNYGNSPWNTLLTCGDALRGLGDGSGTTGTVPAVIKITLDELLQDGMSRDMTGIGVEGSVVRLERLDYFYNSSIIANAGDINNLQVSVASEYIWNTLKIGYRYRENEKLNGKDDPFLTHQYASAGIRIKKERDAVTPFVASPVTQEYVRSNLGGKKTTDSNNDNDTFIAEISNSLNSAGQYLLARPQNDPGNSMTGMLAGTSAYNLSLTPKRNLLRNAPLIHTALHLLDGTNLTFQTADQNAQLQSTIDTTGPVIEKSDVPVAGLSSPLFLPIIFQFETMVPVDIASAITANPYGQIQFNWRGKQYSGFILEVGIKPANNAVYTWKLLAAPNTNLSNLIH